MKCVIDTFVIKYLPQSVSLKHLKTTVNNFAISSLSPESESSAPWNLKKTTINKLTFIQISKMISYLNQ